MKLTLFSSRWFRYLTNTFVLATCFRCTSALAVGCKVTNAHAPSEAESAFLHSEYDRATTLYQAQLQSNPNDPALTAGLAMVLLKQQKVREAEQVVQKALSHNPASAVLLTSLGEVHYREGAPWLAKADVDAAMKADPCYPRLHLLYARVLRLNSFYATAAKEIATAYALDPADPQIRLQWIDTLPIKEHVTELETYLSKANGDDPDTTRDLRYSLEYLKQQLVTPRRSCRLVSNTSTSTIPFADMMYDAKRIRAFGLDVKFNDHNARLQINTEDGGLVISRSVAEHAGLKLLTKAEIGGIGSEDLKPGHIAIVDDIRIGSLEFRDCEVLVIDQRNIVDSDGLIGLDVFSNFLVTLDYPVHKLLLAPLPPRPDDTASAAPTLETASDPGGGDSAKAPEIRTVRLTLPSVAPHDRYVAPEMKDWTAIYRIDQNLLIPASMNNSKPTMFLLATSAPSTAVSPDVAREVTKLRVIDGMHIRGTDGRLDKVYNTESITFKFANISQKVDGVIAFAMPSFSKDLGMEVSGFIGTTALDQMTIGIDYRDGLMKFSYNPERAGKQGR